ncbi:excalibur calcium-binding domain-containing protein [Lysobacter niabensis]|uniref:excalibur calcium-binding domain-containing protein n=1 Tax=Agrilutibacter niabensis TaxID=380628 RepID=UPI00361DEF53
MTIQRAALFGFFVLVSEAASAHGGGLNAEGCHHDRKNGGYHCHRAASARAPANSFAPTPASSQRLTTNQNDSVYFANCSAARAAGAAPVRRGDPGYARHLDRDGDGVGCE